MINRKIKIPDPLKKYVIQDFNKYFFKKKSIAEGGQAKVWLATDNYNKKYAIKEIYIDKDKINRQIKRYLLECAALLRAQHPFIIVFHGMTDEYPFQIVTEYVGPVNLKSFLTNNHFKSQSHNGTHLTKIATAISNAMMFLHKIKIIHRDLKPSNILLGNDYLPKICDFGLVHQIYHQSIMTAELGTPIWMAPEVIRGEPYNEKCDIFSFAMILYQMATHEMPMSDLTSTQIMEKYKNERYRPSSSQFLKAPKPLQKLIIRCWDEDPDKRPSFQEIFEKFGSCEVTFPHCKNDEIKQFARKLKNEDQKRTIIPEFEVYAAKERSSDKGENYSDNSESVNHDKSKSKNRSEYKSETQKNQKKKEEETNKSDGSDDNKKEGKPNKSKEIDDNKKRIKKKEFKTDESDESDYNKKVIKKKKYESDDDIKKKKKTDKNKDREEEKKKTQKKKKFIKIEVEDYDDYDNYYSDRKIIKKQRHKKKSEYSESDDEYDLHIEMKRKTKKKLHYKNDPIDDKNELIFNIDTFRSESKKSRQLSSSSSKDSFSSDYESHSEKFHFKSRTTTKTKKRKPAPDLLIASSSQYSAEESSYEVNKSAKPYSRYTSTTPVSMETLNDVRNPLFRAELEKVKKKDFIKFLKVLKNHLTSRTPRKELILLLRKTNELLDDDECLFSFSVKKIFEFLPITKSKKNSELNDEEEEAEATKNDELCDLSIEILNKVCQSYPQFIEENFETSMLSFINLKPIEAAEFLEIYSDSFDMIENPWPLLDMLIVHKKKFNKTIAGSIVVKTLVSLIQNHKNYRKNRLINCRNVVTFFLNSPVKKNVVAAYKAITVLYDNEFELPFKKIRIDMEDPQLVNSVISLFDKMENIPPVKSIIFSLLEIAQKDEKATEVLIKMAKNYKTASILLNCQVDWMKNKLPTFVYTLKLFLAAISDFRDLQKLVVSDCDCISSLFAYSCKSDQIEDSFLMFEKILKKIYFNSDFLENLQEKKFFHYFFRGINEIDDDRIVLSCLRSFQYLIEIGICDEYKIFYKTLKKLAAGDDKIADEAQYCIDILQSSNKKKRSMP